MTHHFKIDKGLSLTVMLIYSSISPVAMKMYIEYITSSLTKTYNFITYKGNVCSYILHNKITTQ